jgi:hypothetical protein
MSHAIGRTKSTKNTQKKKKQKDMQTCVALSRVLWKSHITKDEIFKPLHTDNPNKKQVGTQFIVMKGNGQKPNMGRKYSSKMPMNKNKMDDFRLAPTMW